MREIRIKEYLEWLTRCGSALSIGIGAWNLTIYGINDSQQVASLTEQTLYSSVTCNSLHFNATLKDLRLTSYASRSAH